MKFLLCVVLLAIVIITAGCVQSVPEKKVTSCDEKYRCNDICYKEPGTCCAGRFYPMDYNNNTYCCGGEMVRYEKGTCCGGKYYSWPPYGTCCGGTFYTTPPAGTCCDGKWYIKGTTGECCPNPTLTSSIEGVPKFYMNGKEVPSWQNYTQVWINADTQHCCAGKAAPGGGKHWLNCGEEACFDLRTQSCCYVGYDQKQHEMIFNMQEGQASCCEGRPSQVNGTYCDPYDGVYTVPNNSSGGVRWDEWSRREMQSDVNRALGFPPGYMGI